MFLGIIGERKPGLRAIQAKNLIRVTRIVAAIIAVTFAGSTAALAQQDHMHDENPVPEGQSIGQLDFSVSCDEAVREDFDYALGMLHHMMYETSRGLFEEITEADPNCAMGYWGIATTLFQPLWSTRPSQEDLQQGAEMISKAMKLVDSDREEQLIESTAAFFREPETADFNTRMQRWIDGVETAYEAHPNDNDIAAFYGLTRLANIQYSDNPDQLYDEAEAVLRDVFEQNPEHPGAIHYTLHATDADGRAENALDMVDAYGEIAPEVPHALHMPSHIYVRLGDWPKVIEWNTRSAEAALDHPVNGDVSHHYIHAIDYMVYGHLQRGEEDKAMAAYEEAMETDSYQPSFISAYHSAAIPARLAVEQRDWEQAVALEPRTPDYLPWDESRWAEGLTWYARGLGAIHTDDIEAAQEAEQQLETLRDEASEQGNEGMATYIDIDRNILSGRIAHAQGNDEEAIELTQTAADLEGSIEKHPVTPGAFLPANEALGHLYADLGRYEEALEAYEASDAIWPGRYYTLLGAARVAQMAGNDSAAEQYYERLLSGIGDTNREAVREAEGYMAGLE